MATRLHFILLGVAAILLFIGLVQQHGQVSSAIQKAWSSDSSKKEPSQSSPSSQSSHSSPSKDTQTSLAHHGPTFHEIGLKYGTDKVTTHQYWFMYDKYFPAIRNNRIKMLEIGLGCDMNYGPGKSYYTWLEYFPNVELYYMEYDASCAEKWAAKTSGATIYTGDQANVTFLEKFVAETGGNFDVVIDDGGHTMSQQQTSLEHLWKIVKPGGMYFIEDLQTSFIAHYGGDPSIGREPKIKTMMKYIYELIDDKMLPDGRKHAMSMEMRGIECQREVCVMFKKEEGTV